jgi:hypothetical protein
MAQKVCLLLCFVFATAFPLFLSAVSRLPFFIVIPVFLQPGIGWANSFPEVAKTWLGPAQIYLPRILQAYCTGMLNSILSGGKHFSSLQFINSSLPVTVAYLAFSFIFC